LFGVLILSIIFFESLKLDARKMPRQSKYKDEYCKKLIAHMQEGFSFESFAGTVPVAKQTLYTWLQEHPEFKEAKEVGSAVSLLCWEKLGLAGAKGEIKGFNAASWIFNVKNRFGWNDKQQVEHSLPDTGESLKSVVEIYIPENGRGRTIELDE
jgi:hypothetical protein